MGHQRKRLKHHAHVAPPQLGKLAATHRRHVLAIDKDVSGRGFDQAVDQANKRGFARTRQAHQDEDFAFLDGKGNIINTQNLPGLAKNVVLGIPLVRSEEHTSELQSLMRISYAVFCLKKQKYDKKTKQT